MTHRCRRLGTGLVVLLALVGCTASPSPTSPASTGHGSSAPVADYGDAPDPSFASLFASNGAHALDVTQFWLGDLAAPSATTEADANVVDRDALDDGLEAMRPQGDGTGLSFRAVKAASAADGSAYFNLLVDLDRDGRWRGADWLAINRVVHLAPGESVAISVDLPLTSPSDAWIRATLTDVPVDASLFPGGWDGTGAFAAGEVEDYFFPSEEPPPTPEPTPTYEPTPTPTPYASPTGEPPPATPTPAPTYVYTGDFVPVCDPVSILHGESVFVPIRLTSGQATPPERFIAFVDVNMPEAGSKIELTPPAVTHWAPWGPGAGFRFTSTAVDPPERTERWRIWLTLQSRSTTRRLECIVEVHHVAASPTATTADTPTLKVQPTVVTRGGLTTPLVNIIGAGFTPGGTVTEILDWPGGKRTTDTVHADTRGNVSGHIAILPTLPAGTYTLTLSDETTGDMARATFQVK